MTTLTRTAGTLDELAEAVDDARRTYGGSAQVYIYLDGHGLALTAGHGASATALAGWVAASAPDAEDLRRDLYFTQRAMGDARALTRGRLPQRLVRRRVMGGIGRRLFGKW